jgi:hypothetical protein
VRGKPAVEALNTLKFLPNKAARHVGKLLSSAVANAEENFGVSRDDLMVFRSWRMKAPPANGGALAPAGASSRCCGARRTSPLCCANGNNTRDQEKLWVEKFIQLDFA